MRRGLKQVIDVDKLPVKMLATDRHLMVGSTMRTEFPSIKHQLDVWYVTKGFSKK